MSIIDELILNPADADTIRKFESLVRLDRLSEKQIAFGAAIIANPSIVAERTAAAHAKIEADMAAEMTRAREQAARLAEEEAVANRGVAEGQRVAITSKKQGRREGVVLWVRGERCAVRVDGVEMAVVTTTDRIEVL